MPQRFSNRNAQYTRTRRFFQSTISPILLQVPRRQQFGALDVASPEFLRCSHVKDQHPGFLDKVLCCRGVQRLDSCTGNPFINEIDDYDCSNCNQQPRECMSNHLSS